MGSGCSARLVELSLPTPEVHSSNPVTANFCKEYLFTVNCIEKMKIKKKGQEWPIFKNAIKAPISRGRGFESHLCHQVWEQMGLNLVASSLFL